MAHGQQVVRIDRERRDPVAPETARRALSLALERLPEADVVVVSDYAKGLIDPALCAGLGRLARRRATPVVVDPKGRDYSKYAGATAITPNKAEAALAANRDLSEEASLLQVGRDLLDTLSCQGVLITRGEEGLSLFQADGPVVHLPTFGRKVYDVTGAGDTVVGTFALALAAGASMAEAAYLANHAAGIVVGRIGAATVTASELAAAVERRAGAEARRRDAA
jgi:D-beta-D-heptose 7-phosphate kinase/D-beta-D-heptose 1-phosphate adenosyltransferase